MLRSILFSAVVSSETDEELLETLDELYLSRENLEGFISNKQKDKTPNELLKEIIFNVDQLKKKLYEDGEKFVDPDTVAQLAFYKSKVEGKNES